MRHTPKRTFGALFRALIRVGAGASVAAIPGFAIVLNAGCASTARRSAGYLESASDVVNRAPASLSMPDQGAAQPLDENAMREQADFHFSVAEAHALDGDAARAIDEYKLALVYDQKSTAIRLRLAAEYAKQSLVSEAVEQCKLALETDPKSIEAYMLLGGLKSALRMYDDALAAYKKAIQLDPENGEAPMFVGALLAEQKKYPEAVRTFEALVKRTNNFSAHLAWYYLGRVLLEQDPEKNRSAAERDLLTAIKTKPTFVDAVLALGAVYEATDRKNEAIKLFRGYQAKRGPDASVAESLSRLYLDAKEYELALEQLAVIESADAENLNAQMKAAFVLIELKRYAEAATKLEDILARAPESDKVRFYLGAVHEETKSYKDAIAAFKKVPVGSQYYGEAVVHAAYLEKLNGDAPSAIKTVESGIKNKPDYAQFYSLSASLLDDAKNYERALEILADGAKRFPDNAQIRYFLGSMQDRTGDFEAMVASMRRVLEIDRNHVQALNYLAYTFADKGTKLEEAESFARKALQLQPGDGYIMDTLGWILFKQGHFNDAIQMLETAIKRVPHEAVIAEHLGDAYYRVQLPEKAKRMYLRATEADASPENVRKLRSKIGAVDRPAAPSPELSRSPAANP